MLRGRPQAPSSRLVLSLDGGPTDRLVIDVGSRLAQATNAELVALHIVEVDWRHDLDDEIAGQPRARLHRARPC